MENVQEVNQIKLQSPCNVDELWFCASVKKNNHITMIKLAQSKVRMGAFVFLLGEQY
jgi:hypothetical protein